MYRQTYENEGLLPPLPFPPLSLFCQRVPDPTRQSTPIILCINSCIAILLAPLCIVYRLVYCDIFAVSTQQENLDIAQKLLVTTVALSCSRPIQTAYQCGLFEPEGTRVAMWLIGLRLLCLLARSIIA